MPPSRKGHPIRRLRTATPLLLIATFAAALLAAPASAAPNLGVGFVDDVFGDGQTLGSANPNVRGRWFDRLKETNANLVRINLYWSQVTGSNPPLHPRDPADDSYNFNSLNRVDDFVLEAKERGLTPVLTVFRAPRWAEGKNRPDGAIDGTWKPSASRFEDFGAAVAKRYSGKYRDPRTNRVLPRVKYFQAWNEPNLPIYITPQYKKKKAKSPKIYRKLVTAFSKGVHSVSKKNQVVAAGTSPFGDRRGGKRIRPYAFWREVLCLKGKRKLREKKGCAKGKKRATFDIFAHNAINAQGTGPAAKSGHRDDGVPSNFGVLKRMIRTAEKKNTLLPKKGKHQGWSTETWYESNPPDKRAVGLIQQARYMEQALYVLWKQGARAVFFLQIRDNPYDPNLPSLANFQTGVYFINDQPKPSLKAVQFPFVVDRKTKRSALIWGKSPSKGKLVVQEKKGKKFKRVTSLKAKRGKVFTKRIRLKGKGHVLRATVGGQTSLTWKLK